jgi:hypothetical protein
MLTETPSRRGFLKVGAGLAAALVVPGCVSSPTQLAGAPPPQPGRTPAPAEMPAARPERLPVRHVSGVAQPLFERAMAARDAHGTLVTQRDRIVIVDFDAPSYRSRLHMIDVMNGASQRLLVTHGIGSDRGHTGYLQQFSNDDGSEATCEGAFATSDYYVGQHGRSQRLLGLDPTNNNALSRAIVIHAAWYANKDMLLTHGKLGRSQGCFAVGDAELQRVFDHLGEGALIYAGKA